MVETIKTTAIHEAGHALANLHFGIPFIEVSVFADGSGHVSGMGMSEPRTFIEAERFTICRIAGYVAEHIALGCELCIKGNDWFAVWTFVRPLFRTEHRFEQFTRKMDRRTVKFMQFRQAALVRIANALLEHRRLTRAEVTKLAAGV